MAMKILILMMAAFMEGSAALSEATCSSATSPAKGMGLMQLQKKTTMQMGHFGDDRCPCIGIDNITGSTTVVVSGSTKTQYPADVGAHCAAWDNGREPLSCMEGQLPGSGHGWCVQPWCYVDICNCNLDMKPKATSYLPDGQYQGRPMHFSYATCGGEDTWSAEQEHKAEVADDSMCDKHDNYYSQAGGKSECKCIGIDGEDGSFQFTVSGLPVTFPASTGASCSAWDFASNPTCAGNSTEIPEWCAKKWCFVDPCSCSTSVPPKMSTYLPYASIGGRPVYFSYDTCGDEDVWTATNNQDACVNQQSEKACHEKSKCGWDTGNKRCLGKDLLQVCHAASTQAPKSMHSHSTSTVAPKAMHGLSRTDEMRRQSAETIVDRVAQKEVRADSALRAAEDVKKAAEVAEQKSSEAAEKAKALENATALRASGEALAAAREFKKLGTLKAREKKVAEEAKSADISAEKESAKVAKKEIDFARSLDALKKLEDAKKEAEKQVASAKSAEKAVAAKVKKAEETVKAAMAAENASAAKAADARITELTWEKELTKLEAAERSAEQKADEAQRSSEVAAIRAEKAKDSEHVASAKAAAASREFSHASDKLAVAKNADKMARADFDSKYGSSSCPCVGIDNITGVTTVVVNGSTRASYPADTGAHCAAWDNGREPLSCMEGQVPGGGHGWCAQPWCYVDPCNCDLDLKPKASSYLPDGMYQSKPIYYSYATCGGIDTWSEEQKHKAQVADNSLCKDEVRVHQNQWHADGKDECKCIGINGEEGSVDFIISGSQVAVPADTGTKCGAWDLTANPACRGNKSGIPEWCTQRWCFVDPCSCPLATPPKTSSYLPHARLGGKSVYYSYDTCGAEDVWTAANYKDACVNQHSEKACHKVAKCGWDADKNVCLGKDLVNQCKHPDPIATTTTTTSTTTTPEIQTSSLQDIAIPVMLSASGAVAVVAVFAAMCT